MNPLFDDMYMKKHIGDYILFQMEQGYALKDIKTALTRYGYKKKVLDDILKQLNITATEKKKAPMYNAADLDNELKIYVQSLLIDYIVKQHKLGYTLEAIRSALINYGHDAKAIDEAILIIEKGRVVDYKMPKSMLKFPQQIASSITLFFIFAFLVFLSVATNTSIIQIIPNFLPAFVTFIIINAIYFFMPYSKLLTALPLVAIALCVGLFIGGIQYGFLGKAPGSDILLMLNAAIAFLSSGVVCAFSKKEKEEIIVKIKDKKRSNENEEALIENKIHEPKLIQQMPKEPYHPSGKPVIPHAEPNTMLHYIKEGINKPIERQPQMHTVHRPHMHPATVHHHAKPVKQMPKSIDALPEKKHKAQRIPLKSIE